MILDVDSSNFETFGDREGAVYNAHYQDTGFYPLFLFDTLICFFLKVALRSGNVYTTRDVGPVQLTCGISLNLIWRFAATAASPFLNLMPCVN
jgi:hypothetical protein